ncbi:MAG: hypothetical protein AAF542_16330 [Pseudomonadota bacterium]
MDATPSLYVQDVRYAAVGMDAESGGLPERWVCTLMEFDIKLALPR